MSGSIAHQRGAHCSLAPSDEPKHRGAALPIEVSVKPVPSDTSHSAQGATGHRRDTTGHGQAASRATCLASMELALPAVVSPLHSSPRALQSYPYCPTPTRPGLCNPTPTVLHLLAQGSAILPLCMRQCVWPRAVQSYLLWHGMPSCRAHCTALCWDVKPSYVMEKVAHVYTHGSNVATAWFWCRLVALPVVWCRRCHHMHAIAVLGWGIVVLYRRVVSACCIVVLGCDACPSSYICMASVAV